MTAKKKKAPEDANRAYCIVCGTPFHPPAGTRVGTRPLCNDCVTIDRLVRALPRPPGERIET
jgi:hypothetical protein